MSLPLNFFVSRLLPVLLLTLLLAGCGFQLKQSPAVSQSLSPVSIEGVDKYSHLYKTIRNSLRQSDVAVASPESANTRLHVAQIKNHRRVLSVRGSGKVGEYELTQAIRFQLFDANGEKLTNSETLEIKRDYAVSSNETLGKDLEEGDLRELMQQQLVDRMLQIISKQVN